MSYAPIALFVFRRLAHLEQTIERLKENKEARHSLLYIYSDGARTQSEKREVSDVRSYLQNIDGFHKIEIVERGHNFGLAANIIDGVTQVIEKHKHVIVLEDDIVTSPYFLNYMNRALDFYEAVPKVMHISGWNYPIEPEGLPETFLWRAMNCWGWATWKDRWRYFSKDAKALKRNMSRRDIFRFDLDGYGDFWSQVTRNLNGEIDTWAVFWYASIFRRQGLCLNPTRSYVRNIGNDGSGENSGQYDLDNVPLAHEKVPQFGCDLSENKAALHRIQDWVLMHSFAGKTNSLKYFIKQKLLNTVRKTLG